MGCNKVSLCLFFAICITQIFAKRLGSLFSFCNVNDENRNECLKAAIVDAVAKIANGKAPNVPSIEPMVIESAEIGQGNGPVNVVQTFKNMKFHNFGKQTTIKNVKSLLDINKFKIEMEAFTTSVFIEGDYSLNGKLLLLPIVGGGKFTTELIGLHWNVTIEGETYDKNGKTYANANNVQLTMLPENVKTRYENLFNGDERLSAEMHKIIHENWRELFEDVKSGYQDLGATFIKAVTNKIFGQIAYKTLFLGV